MNRITRLFCLLAFLVLVSPALPAPLAAGAEPAPAAAQQISPSHLDNFEWRSVGPPGAGGRMIDIEVVGEFPHTIFAAGATGGLWRSTNNGVTFEPIFDNEATNSIGAIAIHPTNPQVIWVGTGENNARNSVSWGDGVYKSTDGGGSWTNVGLRDSHHIGDILIDPSDPQTVYVGALGHFWGASEERGVYKTTDGGETWERVFYVDENTGIVDMAMDARDPDTLYAAAYQVRRDGFSGGNPRTGWGPGSGIFKSTDGGRNWKELTSGLPTGEKGRIGLAVSETDPAIVYAIVQTDTTLGGGGRGGRGGPARTRTMQDGGVFRSTDRGESWEWKNELNPRPFYYSQIRVDPSDPDRVYVLGSSMAVSNDGAENFENVRMNVHVDHHDLWINPANSDHLILGNDGGVYFSYDRGASWDFLDQMALGQFYAIDVDMRDPYYIYGGVQDYMSWGGPSETRNSIGITNSDWYMVMTGDGFQVRIDPSDPNILYAESQGGGLIRHDLRTGQNTRIKPEAPDGDDAYRFEWDTPILISHHDPATVYMGGNVMFRSRDRGNTWEEISDDLTTFTLPPDSDDPEAEPRKIGSASALSESPLNPDLLYVGTNDGNVWMTPDGGESWRDLTEHFPGLTGKRWVSRLVASRFDERRAYAAFDGHRNDDFAPHVYITLDAGETWESIAANIPDDQTVRVIREDTKNPDLLFLGTEFAAYASFDRGGSWLRLMTGMPTVAVADMVVHPREGDLVGGTHGRSAYVMDITPLQELTPEVAGKDLHLFSIKSAEAWRYRVFTTDQFLGEKRWVAENPPYGATISYLVGADVEGRATISIRDAAGNEVRELRGPGGEGIHRVQWNLRHGPYRAAGEADGSRGGAGVGGGGQGGGRGGRGGFGGGGQAPLVRPATYEVTVSIGELSETTTVVVEPDRELILSDADAEARWNAINEIRPLQAELAAAGRSWRELRTSLEEVEESMSAVEAFDDELEEQLDALLEEVREMATEQGRTSGTLNGVYRNIESSPFAPTATDMRRLDEVRAQHAEQQAAYDEIINTEVPAFEQAVNDKGIPRVVIRR